MWQALIGWFKSLFGGKGTMQIGKGNQAITGSTTGPNSPVVTAGGDVHLHAHAAHGADQEAQAFAELEELMPGLLLELRTNLAEHPLLRDIIVLDRKTISYNWPGICLMFSEDENPDIRSQMQVLENHGLVTERKPRFAYRLSEQLARHLTKK